MYRTLDFALYCTMHSRRTIIPREPPSPTEDGQLDPKDGQK